MAKHRAELKLGLTKSSDQQLRTTTESYLVDIYH